MTNYRITTENWTDSMVLGERGAWNSEYSYSEGDVVEYDGKRYFNILETPATIITPDVDAEHWLQKLNIKYVDEPIGLDNLKFKIKRTETHGFSIEVSVDVLEFYGEIIETIEEKYKLDIDSNIFFEIVDIEYIGLLDLSTFKKNEGDYCSISVKIGEFGKLTTFNNRIESKVNIYSLTSLDRDVLIDYPKLKNYVSLPSLPLRLTNMLSYDLTHDYGIQINDNTPGRLDFVFPNKVANEFGKVSTDSNICIINVKEDEQESLNKQLMIKFNVNGGLVRSMDYGSALLSLVVMINGTEEFRSEVITMPPTDNLEKFTFQGSFNHNYTGNLQRELSMYINVERIPNAEHSEETAYFSIEKGTFVQMQFDSVMYDSGIFISMIHESFSRLSEIISGLSVKSDFYGRFNSDVNQLNGDLVGPGALKGIATGYNVRGKFNGDLSLSFKSLFSNLNAIDSIGWGFSYEQGIYYVRVEKWSWFYKNNVIFQINNHSKKIYQVDLERIYTGCNVKIGKSVTSKDLYSVNSIYDEKNYLNTIKVVGNTIQMKSDFILDPYLIERTKRVEYTKESSEDKEIFLFALKIGTNNIITIDKGVTGSGIIHEDKLLNYRLTPKRIALSFLNSNVVYGRAFTSTTNNSGIHGTPVTESGYRYLYDSGNNTILSEDSTIVSSTAIFKPEVIEVSYYMTHEEYTLIKNNPYGIILIDGEKCWLKELEYNINTKEANFKLIPKNE